MAVGKEQQSYNDVREVVHLLQNVFLDDGTEALSARIEIIYSTLSVEEAFRLTEAVTAELGCRQSRLFTVGAALKTYLETKLVHLLVEASANDLRNYLINNHLLKDCQEQFRKSTAKADAMSVRIAAVWGENWMERMQKAGAVVVPAEHTLEKLIKISKKAGLEETAAGLKAIIAKRIASRTGAGIRDRVQRIDCIKLLDMWDEQSPANTEGLNHGGDADTLNSGDGVEGLESEIGEQDEVRSGGAIKRHGKEGVKSATIGRTSTTKGYGRQDRRQGTGHGVGLRTITSRTYAGLGREAGEGSGNVNTGKANRSVHVDANRMNQEANKSSMEQNISTKKVERSAAYMQPAGDSMETQNKDSALEQRGSSKLSSLYNQSDMETEGGNVSSGGTEGGYGDSENEDNGQDQEGSKESIRNKTGVRKNYKGLIHANIGKVERQLIENEGDEDLISDKDIIRRKRQRDMVLDLEGEEKYKKLFRIMCEIEGGHLNGGLYTWDKKRAQRFIKRWEYLLDVDDEVEEQ